MKRRTRRSLPASLTAAVLLAVCVLTAVAAIQRLTGHQPWLDYRAVATAVHDAHWTDLVPALISGAVAVVGLVLLWAALLPGKRRILPLTGDPDSGADSADYRSALRAAAADVDGVERAKLSTGSRKVKVRVKTARTRTDGLADAVRAAVESRLDHISPVRRPAVSVRVRASREAS
ncbi:hypothetical protein CU254_16785 [Amycolatopsis sp. AA4]|uniref:DUF6286 domain-containing protein n=1 Tax=Actinomycetes TaxID=1760 RepID=UPI000563D5C4|nr:MULTISPECIES: DUF6286 domain-containing protein [Actinomycetes]ATY11932.1 hypothetical protein CU254_16785 [Amycolatopsis sp. AA4]